MSSALAPALSFAAHATLWLNGLTSSDHLLGATSIRSILRGEEEVALLEYLAEARTSGVREMACIPWAPGDWQGVLAPEVKGLPPALVVRKDNYLLELDGRVAAERGHGGWILNENVRTMRRQLDLVLAEMTAEVEASRGLFATGEARGLDALSLPAGYTVEARNLVHRASSALDLTHLIATRTMDRDRSASAIREQAHELSRIARSAVAVSISVQTLMHQ